MSSLQYFCRGICGIILLHLGLEAGASFEQNEWVLYPVPSDSEDSQEYSPPSGDQSQGNSMIFETETTRIEVEAAVENTDFISQCRAQRQASQKKKSPHNESSAKDDEEEDYSPKASVSIRWSRKD
jgi:hypothetical protein